MGCLRPAVGVLGVILTILGVYTIYLGEMANFSEELKLLKMERTMSFTLLYTGAGLIFTAGVGWSAVASKNEMLTYCFGYMSLIVTLIFTCIGINLLMVDSHVNKIMDIDCAA